MLYLVSNVKCHKPIPDLNSDDDELVFLNRADNLEVFWNEPCRKYLYCRAKDHGDDYFTRDEWKGRELEVFDGFTILNWKGDFHYPDGKEPTTGFWVWNILKQSGKEVVLVNFFPNRDFSTCHWEGHDWKYEQEVIDRTGKILDLR